MNGYKNEYEFINYLNNKQFKDVHVIFQDLLTSLFPNISDDDFIIAKKYGKYAKADMVIEVNGIKKGISIKCGEKNSVHVEKIDKFVMFLIKNDYKHIEEILRYLYSDGTTNNTRTYRTSVTEYQKDHIEEINNINSSFDDIELKRKLLYRFLINADVNYTVKVDAFIYGTVDNFMWCTTEDVLNFLENKNISSNSLHVGSLYVQQWNKNLCYNPKYEYCREYIQVKWYSMFDDLISIMNEKLS